MPNNIIMADPKGGEDFLIKRITNTLESYTIPNDVTSIANGAFVACSSLRSVIFPQNVILDGIANGVGIFSFSGLTSVHLHTATIKGYSAFRECKSLVTFVGEKITIQTANPFNCYLLYNCTNLSIFDADINVFSGDAFSGCTKLNTIILRKSDGLTTLNSTSIFNNTPFRNGGTGGTIYIPKSLYDHLGDGTPDDYKAASNWSTIDGYGTITWAQIEGSIYENAYADGTPIPSA